MTLRPTLAACALAALSTLAPSAARAGDPPPPGGLFDLTGTTALGTSAATAGSSGTEAIFVNPGATGLRTGYVAEALGVVERRGATTPSRWLGLAVVDAVSSPVATSVAYVASSAGDHQGRLVSLGFSGAATERLHLGVQGRYLKLGGTERTDAVTADAGLVWDASSYLTLGVSGFNLLPVHHPDSLPQVMGAGLAVGSDTFLRVMGDWKGAFLPHGRLANRYAAGGAVLLGGLVTLRAGWMRDELLRTSWWSSGVGVASSDGFAIDAGYRQSIDAANAREVAVSLRYYPQQ